MPVILEENYSVESEDDEEMEEEFKVEQIQ